SIFARTVLAVFGLMLVFEGIDKAGKTTQARLLTKRLKKEGYRCKMISFPVYTTPIGRELKLSLYGRRNYPPQVKYLLMSANRWEMKKELESSGLDFLILNRYKHSNIAYGVASGLDRKWLETLDQGLPEPNKVILLDISPSTSLKRKLRGRDLNEKDLKYLKRVRKTYLKIAKEYGWSVVNAEQDVKEVHKEVWSLVKQVIRKQSTPNP
ncbi:MAG: dTMP kinase, partial [Nitrososphaerales archaeon]